MAMKMALLMVFVLAVGKGDSSAIEMEDNLVIETSMVSMMVIEMDPHLALNLACAMVVGMDGRKVDAMVGLMVIEMDAKRGRMMDLMTVLMMALTMALLMG